MEKYGKGGIRGRGNERRASDEPLWNEFDDRSVSVLVVMALWKGGPHVSQSIHCRVIVVKDVQCIIGFSHERLCFVIQATTVD